MAEVRRRNSLSGVRLHAQEQLHRGLKNRHVQMIAIGGLVLFFIMRALGELLLYKPVSGSFTTYAEEFVGPWAGFMTGWSYWFMWVATGMAEITAVGIYVHY